MKLAPGANMTVDTGTVVQRNTNVPQFFACNLLLSLNRQCFRGGSRGSLPQRGRGSHAGIRTPSFVGREEGGQKKKCASQTRLGARRHFLWREWQMAGPELIHLVRGTAVQKLEHPLPLVSLSINNRWLAQYTMHFGFSSKA